MSLLKLQPRSLMREERTFRDDRLFIVGCDDRYAPAQYFDFFQMSRVHVHVVPTKDGTSNARAVLTRVLDARETAKLEEDDQCWMLLDTDHCIEPNHLPGFMEALAAAGQAGVNLALSRPCFELWLLLHHAEAPDVVELADANEVEKALRALLGEYNKSNLKQKYFPPEKVAHACMQAQQLDRTVGGGDIPGANSSRVYLLMQAICGEIAGGATLCSAPQRHLCSCNGDGTGKP